MSRVDRFRTRRRSHVPSAAEAPSNLRALLDFGASGARAMLVAVRSDGVEVLAYGTSDGDGRAVRREHLRDLAEAALSTAERETTRYRALPAIADVATVGLSGPLLAAEPVVLRLPRRCSEDTVDREELTAAFKRVGRQIDDRIRELETERRVPYRLVATELIGVAVDIKKVDTLPGPSGTPLAVATCAFAWPDARLRLLEEVVADLELELAGVVPTLQAVARAVPVADAVLVEVGHTQTGIGLVEGHRLGHAASVARGGDHFTASICSRLPLSIRAAAVAKHRYALGHGGDEGRQQIGTALASGLEEWTAAVVEQLERLAGQAPLPPHVFLYGGGSRLSEVLVALRTHDWPTTLFQRTPEVEYLYPHQVRGIDDSNGVLHRLDQVGIAALAAWTAHEPNEFEQLLWK